MLRSITPSNYQPALPRDRLIVSDVPDAEGIEVARLVRTDAEQGGTLGEVQIAVLDKAAALGEHNLSGAVVNPRAFRELFPELRDSDFPFRDPVREERVMLLTRHAAFPIPTPPTMRNQGNFTASISEMVRWLGGKAEELGVNILPGFPVGSLLVEGQRVRGVRTAPAGLERSGEKGARYEAPTDLTARAVVLAEGTRGALTQAYLHWQGVKSTSPQIYALGVKELWETKKPLESIVHTLGWPLPRDVFGGSWMYPLSPNLVSLGLVVGLDYEEAGLDVHQLLQRLK